MGNSYLLPIVLTIAGTLPLHAQRVVYEREGSGVLERAMVSPDAGLDRFLARALAIKFLDQYSKTHNVLSLVVGTDELEVIATCFHRMEPPPKGQSRVEQLKALVAGTNRLGPPVHPIARVISLNGDALLTYRDGDSISEEVLRGTDPTRFRVDGIDFHILHLSLSTGSTTLAEDVRNYLTFYVQVKPRVSLSTTLAGFHRLASMVKIANLDLLVRSDAWFLEYDDYPIYPAFVLGLQPLNVNQYELSSYLVCGSSARHHLNCSGRNFVP